MSNVSAETGAMQAKGGPGNTAGTARARRGAGEGAGDEAAKRDAARWALARKRTRRLPESIRKSAEECEYLYGDVLDRLAKH